MKGLFLDDVRNPEDIYASSFKDVEWTVVRDFGEFVRAIESDVQFEIVSFDYWLDANTRTSTTGKDCLYEAWFSVPHKMVKMKHRFHSSDTDYNRAMEEIFTKFYEEYV